jgi:hypothetical protein
MVLPTHLAKIRLEVSLIVHGRKRFATLNIFLQQPILIVYVSLYIGGRAKSNEWIFFVSENRNQILKCIFL